LIHINWGKAMLSQAKRGRALPPLRYLIGSLVWTLFQFDPLLGQGLSEDIPTTDLGAKPENASAIVVTIQDKDSEQESIQFWVENLDASSSLDRRRAEQALLAAGPSILESLPKRVPGHSIEAAERLTRVREILSAQKDAAVKPSSQGFISLSGVKTFGAALEKIGLEAGVSFHHSIDENDPIEMVSQSLPFWHALDLLLDQKKLDINFYGGGSKTLQLVRRRDGRPSRVDSADYRSVFRLEPISVSAKRTLRQTALGGVNIALEVCWEPQVTPIGISFPLQKLKATLDSGGILLPQRSGGTVDVATTSEIAFAECNLPLQLPSGKSERIVSLKGIMRTMIPGPKKRFEIPLLSGSGEMTIDAMTVSLDAVKETDQLYQVAISIDLVEAGRSLESHRQWVFENRVFLERQDGTSIEHLGFEILRQTESGFGVSYLFNIKSDPSVLTLVYESPTSVSSKDIEFELKEIPLP